MKVLFHVRLLCTCNLVCFVSRSSSAFFGRSIPREHTCRTRYSTFERMTVRRQCYIGILESCLVGFCSFLAPVLCRLVGPFLPSTTANPSRITFSLQIDRQGFHRHSLHIRHRHILSHSLYRFDPMLSLYRFDPIHSLYRFDPIHSLYRFDPIHSLYRLDPIHFLYRLDPIQSLYRLDPFQFLFLSVSVSFEWVDVSTSYLMDFCILCDFMCFYVQLNMYVPRIFREQMI